MRVAFFGTPSAAVPALEALLDAADVDVAVVVTNPDRPRGRGHRLAPPPVKEIALAAGVDVWQPGRAREVRDRLAALRCDACAVVAYGSLLPPDVLEVGGAGFVNLHFSLLPAYRGAAPVQAALRAGDSKTGVTCFVLDEGMDTGDVLLTSVTDVGPEETAGELVERLARLGAPLLVDALRGLVSGELARVPQEHERATLAPKITTDDARLDWSAPAEELARLVRAYNPVPGAHTTSEGHRLKVHRAVAAPAGMVAPDHTGAPGEVLEVSANGPVVACGDGVLVLTEVQPAGRARMDGAAWARGRDPVGQRLGA